MGGVLSRYGERLLGRGAEKTDGKGGGLNLPTVDLDLPIDEAEYLVFDAEMTGLNPRRDSIVAIGAVKMEGAKIMVGEHLNRVVDPRTELTGTSVVIHGITPTEAAKAPSIEQVLPEFIDLCRGKVLVGHVVSIDLRFLNRETSRLYGANLDSPAVDTMSLHGFLRKREGDYCSFHEGVPGRADLFSLAASFGIPIGRAHHALYDAFITAQLFQRYLNVLPRYGIRTIRDLRRVGKP